MVKKRLIFTLLYRNGKFNLSRNFSLQAVGDFEWLIKNYDFENVMFYIDELIVLNVDRDSKLTDHYLDSVKEIVKGCFIPIACGGGIKTIDDAYSLLNVGADKIVINTLMTENPTEVEKIIHVFGSQFVVGSIDYTTSTNGSILYSQCARINTGIELEQGVKKYQDMGIGELFLSSIQKDGTGQGFDIPVINQISKLVQVPLIVSGGAGKPEHFEQAFSIKGVDAVSTANLFNFMSGGLKDARSYLMDKEINLAKWKI
ncbi:MAG: HisA/HisF-related TIM barrel protein [Bacteroidia bacterium]|nr:HisA/HisF-related TIM barrel protein [Bacteroidia bacterium]